jgi:hypothetical protein
VAVLIYGPIGWQAWQETHKAKRQRGWIEQSFQQLQAQPPPSLILLRPTNRFYWITGEYLIFSNGWAAYKMHSVHANDGMDDLGLMRSSSGNFYFSHFHFCGGFNSDFRDLQNLAEKGCPRDVQDFLKNYATSWVPFSGKQ